MPWAKVKVSQEAQGARWTSKRVTEIEHEGQNGDGVVSGAQKGQRLVGHREDELVSRRVEHGNPLVGQIA